MADPNIGGVTYHNGILAYLMNDEVNIADISLGESHYDDHVKLVKKLDTGSYFTKIYRFLDVRCNREIHDLIDGVYISVFGESDGKFAVGVYNADGGDKPVIRLYPSIGVGHFTSGLRLGNEVYVIGTNDGKICIVDLQSIETCHQIFREKFPITALACDLDFLFVASDASPEIHVYHIKSLLSGIVAPIQVIPISVASIHFPIMIKTLLRPPRFLPSSTPTGSLFIQTDRMIMRYSFESKSVATFQAIDCRELLLGPFDNGPLMCIEYGTENFSILESIGSRYRIASDVRINNLLTALVSPARDRPRIWTLRFDDSNRRVLLGSWGLRNGLSPSSSRAGAGCL
jgi:hypothetical protein